VEAQCQRKSARKDSQEVGLEAAILERVRNSSLVECAGTDNVARLKPPSEAVDRYCASSREARGSQDRAMVGERCAPQRSLIARTGGARASANAGMSSVMGVRIPHTESLRVPGQRWSSQGESGPKPRTS
jgi:hypothetical protein